jgi:S1-C subfamily serine protease
MAQNIAAQVKLTAAILVGLGAVAAAVRWPRHDQRPLAVEQPKPQAAPAVVGARPAPPAVDPAPSDPDPGPRAASLEDVIGAALPAVVRIETPTGLGSGFFVAPDAILTNAHVVGANPTVRIRLATGSTFQGTVYSTAPDFDLALVKVSGAAGGFVPLTMGSGLRARPGREVVALGSPLGLQNTVTRGIVSAVRQAGPVMLVQTDAAINPGNSGGPLVDGTGHVIAIATMTVKPAEGHGLSFGVAIEHAQALIEGRLPARATGSPMSALDQLVTPAPAAPAASGPDPRQEGVRAFEETIARLAREADTLDSRWRPFIAGCYVGELRGAFDRPWFALFDARAFQGAVSAGCEASFAEFKQYAAEIRDGVRTADESARRADVYPGTRRDVLQRYRLNYDGWFR